MTDTTIRRCRQCGHEYQDDYTYELCTCGGVLEVVKEGVLLADALETVFTEMDRTQPDSAWQSRPLSNYEIALARALVEAQQDEEE
jgi:hypothetical protein